ncbi:periplasmic heavy metal sensor [Algoriphagus namhaensis]|uniref:Periplasmic heavy metal sensor n=1 Tax=Algoriphagus namhaensis TaxID=915353 RepID=A0ABV8AN52_9BACT
MKNLATLLLFFLCIGLAEGQQTKSMTWVQSQPKESGDIFQGNLYSADRVMEMRDKLKLTDAQASKIKKIHADNAGQFATLKWDLDEETKKLNTMLEANNPDGAEVQKQMDKVLALESELKKKKLGTLVAIKNELNDEQIETLKNSATTVTGSYFFQNNSNNARIIQGQAKGIGYTNGEAKVLFPDTDKNKVMIRVDSDKSGNKPLFIIKSKEGEEERNEVGNLDPNDIESMSVLKGSAATSLYGSKGENGVIIITVKDDKKKKN